MVVTLLAQVSLEFLISLILPSQVAFGFPTENTLFYLAMVHSK